MVTRARGPGGKTGRPKASRRGILVEAFPFVAVLTLRIRGAYPRWIMNVLKPPPSRRRAGVAAFALLLVAAAPAAAQTFAAGGGGGAIADVGANVTDNSFSHFGGYVFFEASLETYGARNDVLLQARGQFVTLPGGAPGAPDIQVNSGLVIVTYRYREPWWEAGLLAGLGVFDVSPRAPGTDQVAADPAQTVFGWCVGDSGGLPDHSTLRFPGRGLVRRAEDTARPQVFLPDRRLRVPVLETASRFSGRCGGPWLSECGGPHPIFRIGRGLRRRDVRCAE